MTKRQEKEILELKAVVSELDRKWYEAKTFLEIGDEKLIKAYKKVDNLIIERNNLLKEVKTLQDNLLKQI